MKLMVDGKGVKVTAENLQRVARAIDSDRSILIRTKKTSTRKGIAAEYTNKQLGTRTKADRSRAAELRREKGFQRTASDNAELYRTHEASGRNPLFLAPRERKAAIRKLERGIVKHFTAIFKKSEKKKVAVPRITMLDATLGAIGKAFVMAIRNHINRGRSKSGSMRPNAPRYEKWKRRTFGKNAKPLVMTGQMRRSIYHEVTDASK